MKARPSKAKRAELTELVQYLNLEEMRVFCRLHSLPMMIHIEGADGRLRKSSDRDRKDVVLQRILDFALDDKSTGPTVYVQSVVSDQSLPGTLTGRTRVHYGQYEKHNPAFVDFLRERTDGAFRTGMIARLVLRDFWTAGEVPTMNQFAKAWLQATAEHTEPRPEGAYLVDLAKGEAGKDWKQVRIRKAKRALDLLGQLLA